MKNIWENPEIQELNRLPMRSPLIPYCSTDLARKECAKGPEKVNFSESSLMKSLNGNWKFNLLYTPNEDTIPSSTCHGWTTEKFNTADWANIQVPGTWTLQGFDYPHYTNVQMPFDTVPPRVPQYNPTGLYRLTTSIPSEWEHRRIILHIGSAESCTLIWINGKQVGISKDTRLPCEFDITSSLIWENHTAVTTIAIKVIRYSDASFVEDQDQWWFGGIHRSVFLYSTENVYIDDIEALTTIKGPIHNNKATGIVPLKITIGFQNDSCTMPLTNKQNLTINHLIKYDIRPLKGNPDNFTIGDDVFSGTCQGILDYKKDFYQFTQNIVINDVLLWSTEYPNLYMVTVSLFEQETTTKRIRHRESTAFTIGFKSTQIKDRKLLINEQPVYIYGVNRHEHNEYHGKTLSTKEMIRDIKTLKQYNFNAVRTCHYPDDERWYELCDRYGIYLMDEANIENHAYYDCITRSDLWTYTYMNRIQRMVRRDKNHASIFCWSLGNESGDGQNQIACQAWLRKVDHTRIIQYEGFVRPELTQGEFTLDTLARGKGLTDLISPMYPSIDLIVEYAKTREDYRPVIMCEYSHAMGNANGSLSDYWSAIKETPGLQGGFIWDWIDQGLAAENKTELKENSQGGKYWKYGGDFGDTPSDYDFCLNGINFPDQTPKPVMKECKKLFSPVTLIPLHPQQGIFKVQNLYDFSTLDNIRMDWSILCNGTKNIKGSISFDSLQPGTCSEIHIQEIPDIIQKANSSEEIIFHTDFIYINATSFAPADSSVCKAEFILCEAKSWQSFSPLRKGNNTSELYDTPSLEQIFSFAEKIKPSISHAFTENECIKRELPNLHSKNQPMCFFNKPTAEWIDTDIINMQVNKISDTKFELLSGKDSIKDIKFGTFSRRISHCRIKNSIDAVQINILLQLSDAISEYPRAGIEIPVSAAYKNVTWYGKGPQECYSDRKEGAFKGLYSKQIQDLEVPYIVPQENGLRCDVNYIELAGDEKKLHIQSLTPFQFSISKYTDKDLFLCEHHNELTDLSKGDTGYYILHIDAEHRGVGTGACGPDTLEKYRIRPGQYSLTLVIW